MSNEEREKESHGVVTDDVRSLLAYVYGMGAAYAHNATVEGGYSPCTHNEWRAEYRESIDEAISEDPEMFEAVREVIYELTRKEVLHAPYVMRCADKLSAAIGEG